MRTGILHLADLHLGDTHSYLAEKAEDRRREADSVLARAVDWVLADDSPIGGVLLAGDLFDRHDPPAGLVESVLADLGRLQAAGIRILTVPGNHDEYSYPSGVYRRYAARWPGTLVTQPVPSRVDVWALGDRQIDLYAMAYVAGRSRPPYDRFQVEPGNAFKVVVLHGSLDVEWSDRSLPLSSSSLGSLGLDYVALGHIHVPRERRLASGWLVYPGRIEGGGFDDPGGAGLVWIDTAEEEPVPRRQPFTSRAVHVEDWNLGSFGSAAELEARLEAASDPGRILRIELTGLAGFPVEPETLLERHRGRFYHLEFRQPEGALPPLGIDALLQERTIRGEFARIAARERAAARTPEEQARTEMAYRHGMAAFLASGLREDESRENGRAGC